MFSLQVPGKKKPPEKLSSGGSADVGVLTILYLIHIVLSIISPEFP